MLPPVSTSYTSIEAKLPRNSKAMDISPLTKSNNRVRMFSGCTGFVLISLGFFRKGRRMTDPEAYKSGAIASKAEMMSLKRILLR